MRPQEVSVELQDFVRKQIGLSSKRKLNTSDSLEDDFGVTGDDADEFMGAFAKRFNVESGDFEFLRYFEMEGLSVWPFSILTNWLHRHQRIKKYEKTEPITLGMLQHAIDLGIWDSQRLSELEDPSAQE